MTGHHDGKYVPPIANAPKAGPPIVPKKNQDYRVARWGRIYDQPPRFSEKIYTQDAPKVEPPRVSEKNQDYRDTYDELERIYQEVLAEGAEGMPPGWIIPLHNEGPPKKPGRLRELLTTQPPWTEPPPPKEPEPQGVTLEELFLEDEDGE